MASVGRYMARADTVQAVRGKGSLICHALQSSRYATCSTNMYERWLPRQVLKLGYKPRLPCCFCRMMGKTNLLIRRMRYARCCGRWIDKFSPASGMFFFATFYVFINSVQIEVEFFGMSFTHCPNFINNFVTHCRLQAVLQPCAFLRLPQVICLQSWAISQSAAFP